MGALIEKLLKDIRKIRKAATTAKFKDMRDLVGYQESLLNKIETELERISCGPTEGDL